jgi:hypothetical protein
MGARNDPAGDRSHTDSLATLKGKSAAAIGPRIFLLLPLAVELTLAHGLASRRGNYPQCHGSQPRHQQPEKFLNDAQALLSLRPDQQSSFGCACSPTGNNARIVTYAILRSERVVPAVGGRSTRTILPVVLQGRRLCHNAVSRQIPPLGDRRSKDQALRHRPMARNGGS